MSESKKYTRAEVAQHCTEEDAWIIFQNNVYDLSSFKHPGGWEAIRRNIGQDATSQILAVPTHQEKMEKIEAMLQKMCIGQLLE